MRNTTPLERWRNDVSIMLEKSEGKIYILKLRAILLLEADFSTLNKIVFSNRSLPAIKASKTIPSEVIGGRRD